MHDAARKLVRELGSNPSVPKPAALSRRLASGMDRSAAQAEKPKAKFFNFLGQDGVFLAVSQHDVGKPVLVPKRPDAHRKTLQSVYNGEVEDSLDSLDTELHTFGTGFWHS
jgi:hypothetical protein